MLSYRIDEDLELAIPRIKDAEALYDAIASSRESLRRYLPWVDHVKQAEDEIASIQHDRQRFAADEGLDLLIWYQGQLAGKISFNGFDHLNEEADVGYWLAEAFRGQGLMTRSLESSSAARLTMLAAMAWPNGRACALKERRESA